MIFRNNTKIASLEKKVDKMMSDISELKDYIQRTTNKVQSDTVLTTEILDEWLNGPKREG